MLITCARGIPSPVATAAARTAPVDTLAPARPVETVPDLRQLQKLCAPPSRESFFELANRLFAEERPVRELPWEFARHPDPAVRAAFRIASQELGRSKMSEMERQERVNGGYEAITFLLAQAPEEVDDERVTVILDRLPKNDLTARYCLQMTERVPCKAHLFARYLPEPVTGPVVGVRDGKLIPGEKQPWPDVDQWIEDMGRPELRSKFEAEKETWLGLADRWEEQGKDDRLGYCGVYGLDLYAAMAEHFPHWKPEERIGPLLVQNQVNDGHGMKWLRTFPLDELDGMKPGRARFQLMQAAVEKGHRLSPRQKDELLSWFYPLHQGMIHLPWDWSGCRREALSCLVASLPQLGGETLPDGQGGRLPVPRALTEHLLQGPDTDVTLAFENEPKNLLAAIAHPELERTLLSEVPDRITSWKDMPQRARNATALLALLHCPELDGRLEPLVTRYQDRQDSFVAASRGRWVARQVAAGNLDPLVEMARDRRLRAELTGHPAPQDPAVRRAAADRLASRLAPDTPELALATALLSTYPELGEGVEKVVLQDPRVLNGELRDVLEERLAGGVHSDERQRLKLSRLLGEEPWRQGARGWVGEVCAQIPEGDLRPSVELLLTQKDPAGVARAVLERVQLETLLRDDDRRAELFQSRLKDYLELGPVALEPPSRTGGSVLVKPDAVVVGGTQLKVRGRS